MPHDNDDRCKECKRSLLRLLEAAYDRVEVNYQTSLPSLPERYADHPYGPVLKNIYDSLASHRGHQEFAKAKQLSPVDFFICNHPGRIIEFDESQHFTMPRQLALALYPQELELGFSQERWLSLCSELNKRDNDPPYRDEQRAWYDTLRDFAPLIHGYQPTVRLYSRDNIWCSLDATKLTDLERFKQLIERNEK